MPIINSITLWLLLWPVALATTSLTIIGSIALATNKELRTPLDIAILVLMAIVAAQAIYKIIRIWPG